MLENYFPVLLFIIVGLAMGVAPMLLGGLAAPHRPNIAKLSPYECGFEAFEDARDLEIAFLFPWAVVLKEIGLFGFIAMVVFLAILVVGFIYEWKKGALEWE